MKLNNAFIWLLIERYSMYPEYPIKKTTTKKKQANKDKSVNEN